MIDWLVCLVGQIFRPDTNQNDCYKITVCQKIVSPGGCLACALIVIVRSSVYGFSHGGATGEFRGGGGGGGGERF